MDLLHYIAPFFGAVALEVVHWHQLRDKLHLAKYKALLRSPSYWGITVAMVVVGGVFTLIWFQDRLTAAELMLAGAGSPTLLKKLTAAFLKKQTLLGEEDEDVGIRDYFYVNA